MKEGRKEGRIEKIKIERRKKKTVRKKRRKAGMTEEIEMKEGKNDKNREKRNRSKEI